MVKPVVLNNVDHKDLRVITSHSPALSEHTMIALALPFEFRQLQHEYPIVFYKNEHTQTFQAVVLLGLEQDENLYLTDQGWDANYIPLMIARQPFMLGMREPDAHGDRQPMLLIDTSSPKVNYEEGERVFLPHGGHSEYLQKITDILGAIHARESETRAFHEAITKYDLLESFFLDVSLQGNDKHRLSGYYTINEDKLNALDDSSIVSLQKTGMLALIYFVLASQENFTNLINRKKAQHHA